MATRTRGSVRSPAITLIAVLVAAWLVIGVIAAVQRDYFSSTFANCARVGTTVTTILAGPLNYFGLNPQTRCELPQPSQ